MDIDTGNQLPSDTIDKAVIDVEKIINDLGECQYLLLNGSIEIFLKSLVGISLEKLRTEKNDISYAMDKRVDGHEIDLMVFSNGKLEFAVEFKCTLAKDPNASKNQAKKAKEQISKSIEILSSSNPKAKSCIVHFLINSRAKEEVSSNPEWIRKRYPNKDPIKASSLEKEYRKTFTGKTNNIRTITFTSLNRINGIDEISAVIVDAY
ncbi:hypothetical protein A11A3_16415 [Alcanivorax hongdengensis A-11-3]|uniref:Uncharacterized protein n=1 Tax=Alcanivorax hongdengensis A-11-3 TaxID=1177179 RepID=L0WA00_9GAMM|nr:hypothetical protein [Alcanivorax hongdengensis]EKF72882.1 hypothetical protein A11A3_16415 [Alcanivorax hongdengensis A-11-3]